MVERNGIAPQLGFAAMPWIAISQRQHELTVAHPKDWKMSSRLTSKHFRNHSTLPVAAVGGIKVVGSRRTSTQAVIPEGLPMFLKLWIPLLDARR
jgi:hypothetical protein